MAEPTDAAATPRGSTLLELVDLFERLRRECAWKAAQTHTSLSRYLLEEAHEAVEAIDAGDPDRIRDELGDVLLQVYLHAAIAAESGTFDIEDVATGLHAKMVRRNPHVFSDRPETDPERIDALWHQVKATEGRPAGRPLDGVPEALPALLRATKLLERLERAGTDPVLDLDSTDVGERLLALVAEARGRGVDPEQALRQAVRRREV